MMDTGEESISRETDAKADQPTKRGRWKKLSIIMFLPCIVLIIFGWNELTVGRNLRAVTSIPGNDGVKATAHYKFWIEPNVVVFDITGLSNVSRLDVFRVFLQFAEREKDHAFSEVVLSRGGQARFTIEGRYFKELGEEYSYQNLMYTIRTFPPNVANMEGVHPYSEYEGGIFAVLAKEMDQFGDFMDVWLD